MFLSANSQPETEKQKQLSATNSGEMASGQVKDPSRLSVIPKFNEKSSVKSVSEAFFSDSEEEEMISGIVLKSNVLTKFTLETWFRNVREQANEQKYDEGKGEDKPRLPKAELKLKIVNWCIYQNLVLTYVWHSAGLTKNKVQT